MPKSTNKKTSNKPIILRLSSWRRDWKPFIKRTLRHSVLQFPSCLAMSSLAVLVLAAVLYVSLRSSEFREELWGWIEELTVTAFIIVVILFAVSLILVFVFSLHPKTRRISSKLSTFIDEPEVEKLKERVGTIESGLASTNERIDRIDKRLDNIENKLGNIETTLTTLVNKENKAGKE